MSQTTLAIPNDRFVIELPVDVRLTFIRKVYGLFLLSLLSTTLVTAAIMSQPAIANLAGRFYGSSEKFCNTTPKEQPSQ